VSKHAVSLPSSEYIPVLWCWFSLWKCLALSVVK
jgi:hypothetical protein